MCACTPCSSLGVDTRRPHPPTTLQSVSALGGEERELAIAKSHFGALTRHMEATNVKHWWYGMIEDVSAVAVTAV